MPFQRTINQRCLRGLQLDYHISSPPSDERLAEALVETFNHRLNRYEEQWPDRLVIRLILKFQLEIRLGEKPGCLCLIHRVSASPQLRQDNQKQLEQALTRLVG